MILFYKQPQKHKNKYSQKESRIKQRNIENQKRIH